MERKTLGKILKVLFPMVASAIIGLSYLGPVMTTKAAEVGASGNAYTVIDDNESAWSYGTLTVDPYDGPQTGLNGRERRVIGFDTPDVELATIGRLGITITSYTYKWYDLFHTNPSPVVENFLIRSTDTETYGGTIMFLSTTDPIVFEDDGFTLPAIGTISGDFMAYQEDCLTVLNSSSETPVLLGESDFYTRDWYVILPIAHTISEIIISIDAYTTAGAHISDGLDGDGNPTNDPQYGDYISLFPDSARSVYFTADSTISRIEFLGSTSGSVIVEAGRFNYDDNSFGTVLYSHEFTANGFQNISIDIPFTWNVVVTFVGEGTLTSSLRVYYESEKAATLYNVRGSDGNEGSHGTDPIPPAPDPWWVILLKSMGLYEVWNKILLGFYITLSVAGLLLLFYVGLAIYNVVKKK